MSAPGYPATQLRARHPDRITDEEARLLVLTYWLVCGRADVPDADVDAYCAARDTPKERE